MDASANLLHGNVVWRNGGDHIARLSPQASDTEWREWQDWTHGRLLLTPLRCGISMHCVVQEALGGKYLFAFCYEVLCYQLS